MVVVARRFVQQLHDPASLSDDLLEVDLRAAGVMDERELPDEWEALRTPQRQKAISRVIERRGLASWIEGINQTPLSQGQRARLVESVEAHLLNPSAAPTPATPSMASGISRLKRQKLSELIREHLVLICERVCV
jgi:hypothetical protein